jgi:hypothetical protein
MGFLRTIVIIFIIFYLLRLFMRYILPSLFVGYVDSKMNEFSKKQQRQQEQAKKREGEVTIDYAPDKPSKDKRSGEYVDYVEVKD